MSRALDSAVGLVLRDPYRAEPFRRTRNAAPELRSSEFCALVCVAISVRSVIVRRRTTFRVLDSGQPHNGKVHRARAQGVPPQTRWLTGSVCNAWLSGIAGFGGAATRWMQSDRNRRYPIPIVKQQYITIEIGCAPAFSSRGVSRKRSPDNQASARYDPFAIKQKSAMNHAQRVLTINASAIGTAIPSSGPDHNVTSGCGSGECKL
jgi:hypothetical protein